MSKKRNKQQSSNGAPAGGSEPTFVDPVVAKAAVAAAAGASSTSLPPVPELPKPARPITPPEALAAEAAANRIAILQSPSYRLAEIDVDFLRRKENRPLRMQLEMLKAETLLH